MTLLAARDVSIVRGGSRLLAGVSLVVAARECVAVVGRNGAGKTTLLRALAGLLPLDAGHVAWRGGPLPPPAERCGAIGILFQSEAPVPFSVRAMVGLGLGRDGPLGELERRAVDEALDRLDLTALAKRVCTTLSGGEWQRVRLARALVARPRVLLLDEPTNHLDPGRRAELLALLARLRAEVAVVMATHDLAVVNFCDRAIALAQGRVIADAAPARILAPAMLRRIFAASEEVVCPPRPLAGMPPADSAPAPKPPFPRRPAQPLT